MDGDGDPEDVAVDVLARSPWARLQAWLGPPSSYQLTRWLILRLLGLVYAFAFLGLIFQGPALLGSHGLTRGAAVVLVWTPGFRDILARYRWPSPSTQ